VSYSSTILAEATLAAYWRLGEGVGATQAVDSATSPDSSSSVAGVTFGVAGGLYNDASTAGRFNGVSGGVIIPNAAKLNSTVAIAFDLLLAPTSNSGFQNILSKPGQYFIYSEDGWITVKYLQFYGTSSSTIVQTQFGGPTGGWRRLKASFDGNSQTISINSIGVDSWSGFGGVALTVPASPSPLTLGNDGTSNKFYGGALQEVAIYTAALSQAQDTAHQAAAERTVFASNFATKSPRTVNVYSKVSPGQNTQACEEMQGACGLNVLDIVNLAAAYYGGSGGPFPNAKQGAYFKTVNPNQTLLGYIHSPGWAEAEIPLDNVGAFMTIAGTAYYIAPEWFLCYAEGVTITQTLASVAGTGTHTGVTCTVSDGTKFSVGDYVLITNTDGVTNPEPCIVTGIASNTLTLTRNVFAQGHFTSPSHASGDWIRPIIQGQGGLQFRNMTANCPASSVNTSLGAQTCVQFISTLIALKLGLDANFTGIMDGWFYDNMVDSLTSLTTVGIHNLQNIDLANSNVANQGSGSSTAANNAWAAGMTNLEKRSRMCLPMGAIVLGNTGGNTVATQAPNQHGGMIEGVDQNGANGFIGTAAQVLTFYTGFDAASRTPQVGVFNATTTGKASLALTQTSYQSMRFTLSRCLIEGDWFYNHDDIGFDVSHGQGWWYDEYAVDPSGNADNPPPPSRYATSCGYLGNPTGAGTTPVAGVRQRLFDKGLVYNNANGSPTNVTVPAGNWKRINGTQAPTINSGAAVAGGSTLSIPALDGLILVAVTASVTGIPGTPVLTTDPLAPASIILNWTASSTAGATYNVFRGTTSGGETLLHSAVSGLTYTDTTIVAGTQYYYKLTASSTGNSDSALTAEATLSVAVAPSGLSAVVTGNSVALTWTPSTTPGATYSVYKGIAGPGSETLLAADITTTSYTDTLAAGQTAYYKVAAVA
jgi:hypothetical protein